MPSGLQQEQQDSAAWWASFVSWFVSVSYLPAGSRSVVFGQLNNDLRVVSVHLTMRNEEIVFMSAKSDLHIRWKCDELNC